MQLLHTNNCGIGTSTSCSPIQQALAHIRQGLSCCPKRQTQLLLHCLTPARSCTACPLMQAAALLQLCSMQ